MNKYIVLATLIGMCVLVHYIQPPTKSHAATFGSGSGSITIPEPDVKHKDIDDIVRTIYNTTITISGILFIILFLVGGIMYLTSGGSEENSGRARKLIIDAVIGLVIVLAAWAVSDWILSLLKGSGGDLSTPTTNQPYQPSPDNRGELPTPDPIDQSNNQNIDQYNSCKSICDRDYENMKQNYGCNEYLRQEQIDDFNDCLERFGIIRTHNECLSLCREKYL
jgi:hypothetical protein